MAMSKRARSKGLRKSEQLLGAGTGGREYGVGVVGPDPRKTAALMVLILAVAIALSFVFLGVIIIPGVLLVAAIFGAIDRPASVAVTNQGVAVLARSQVSGRPRKVLTVLPHAILADQTISRSGSYVHLPIFHLWFRENEYERLLGATGATLVANQWAVPVPVGAGAPFPSLNLAPAPPRGAVGIASPPAPVIVAGSAAPTVNESDVIYCSWCGKQRAVNAQAIHYCGSMERPVVYCMNCGTSLEQGAAACSCGTPVAKTSR